MDATRLRSFSLFYGLFSFYFLLLLSRSRYTCCLSESDCNQYIGGYTMCLMFVRNVIVSRRMHPNKCVLLSAECGWSIRSSREKSNVHRVMHIAEV